MSKVGRAAYSESKQRTRSITSDTTLQHAWTGETIFLGANGIDITLPPAKAGMYFTVILAGDYASAVCTVVQNAATEDFYGHVFGSEGENAGTDADTGASANTKITFTTASMRGDRVELVSDGSVWYVAAYAKNYAGITFDN